MKKTLKTLAVLLAAVFVLASVSCGKILPAAEPIPIEGSWGYSCEDSSVDDYYWLHLIFNDLKADQMDLVYEYAEKSDVEAAAQEIASAFILEFSEDGGVTRLVDPDKYKAALVYVYNKVLALSETLEPADFSKLLSEAGYNMESEEVRTVLSLDGELLRALIKGYGKGYISGAENMTSEDVARAFGGAVREDGMITAGYAAYTLDGSKLDIATAYSGSYTLELDYDGAYKDGLLSVEKIDYFGPGGAIENEVEEISFLRICKGMALVKITE